jgi:hypothetical protein
MSHKYFKMAALELSILKNGKLATCLPAHLARPVPAQLHHTMPFADIAFYSCNLLTPLGAAGVMLCRKLYS